MRRLFAVALAGGSMLVAGLVVAGPAEASEAGTIKEVQDALRITRVVGQRSVADLNVRVVKVKLPRKAGTQYYVISRGDYGPYDDDTFEAVYAGKVNYCAFGFFDDYDDASDVESVDFDGDGVVDYTNEHDSSWDDSIVYVCPATKGPGSWYTIGKNRKARRYAQRALNRL